MKINFISSNHRDGIQFMHSKSDITGIMIGNETNKTIKEIFQSRLTRHQIRSETSIKGSSFIFHSLDGMYHESNKISLNRGGSYMDYPDWIKNKTAAINSITEWNYNSNRNNM